MKRQSVGIPPSNLVKRDEERWILQEEGQGDVKIQKFKDEVQSPVCGGRDSS